MSEADMMDGLAILYVIVTVLMTLGGFAAGFLAHMYFF